MNKKEYYLQRAKDLIEDIEHAGEFGDDTIAVDSRDSETIRWLIEQTKKVERFQEENNKLKEALEIVESEYWQR